MVNVNNMPQSGGGQALTENLEVGVYPARVAQVIYLGMLRNDYNEETKKVPARPKVYVTYELDEPMLDSAGKPVEDKPHWKQEEFFLSHPSNDKAKSTARFQAIDPGMKNTDGDVLKLASMPCQVTIVETKTGKKKVGDVSGVSKRMAVPELMKDPVVFDRDEPNMEVYEKLPDFLKNKMLEADDFAGSALDVALNGDNASPKQEAPSTHVDDDDVPY